MVSGSVTFFYSTILDTSFETHIKHFMKRVKGNRIAAEQGHSILQKKTTDTKNIYLLLGNESYVSFQTTV